MAQTILLKRSSTGASVPVVGDLLLGELAINTNDGQVFFKKDNGTESIIAISNDGHSHVMTDVTGLVAALANKIDTAEKGAANGVATLGADSKIPTGQLPALAITDTFTATDEASQLALTVQKGDVCVRTDENKSYIALNDTNAAMADWQELLTPTDTVLSVNSQTGAVVLDTDDINEGTTNLYFTDARAIAAIGGDINDAGNATDDLWSADKIGTFVTTQIDNNSAPHSDTVDPTASDDNTANYFIGQTWINSINNTAFICVDDSTGAAIWNQLSVASGTVTGGANIGTAGVGVYKDLNGNTLEFKKINAGSSKVTITDDVANNEVDIDVVINDSGTTVNDIWSGNKITNEINTTINNTVKPHSATVDPTSSDDNTGNYFVGQVWVNTATDRQFIAVDVSTGAAIWKEIVYTDDNVDGGSY